MKKITLFTMLLAFMSLQAQLGAYQFQESSGNTYSSLTGMTTLYSGADYDDEETSNIPIGFDFKFAGQTYSTVTIGVNGAISFTETNIHNGNDLASTIAGKINMVAPFWDDLKLFDVDGGVISYKSYGTAPNRGFVVEWKNIRRYGQSGTMTFSLFLKETTNYIKFLYDTNTVTSNDGSIGFNANTGSATTFVSVTPNATTSTVSTATANNAISSGDFPAGKLYTFSPKPANDSFFDAIDVTLNDCANPVTAYNAGASPSGGATPSCGSYVVGTRDIWYKFTAPQRGAVKLTRSSIGNWSSLSFAIHTGLNDDPVYCDYIANNGDSRSIYNLIPGDIYYVRMWDFHNDDFGYITFCMESLDNDGNTNHFPLTVQPESATSYVETYANNVNATASPNPPVGADGYNGGDIWFDFVAPSNGQLAVVHSDIAGDWSSFAFTISTGMGAAYDAHGVIYIQGSYTPPYAPVVISGLTAGTTYYLRAWDYNNDNFGNSPFYLREDTTTGIEDYTSLNFNYYPNPTTDIMSVNAENNIETISIMNLMGQEVLKIQPATTQTSIDLSALKAGVYMMRVQMGDQTKTVKVIKK